MKQAKLLWIDLEMTGLDPQKDRIVEVGAVITDWNFKELAKYQSGVGQDKALLERLFKANPWAAEHAKNTKSLTELSLKSPDQKTVENELIKIIDDHFAKGEPALLAGNSIHQDRRFIKKWWPELDKRLHYRMLDVSAWKVVMQGKFNIEFKKSKKHRALDDIYESIEELKAYIKRLKF